MTSINDNSSLFAAQRSLNIHTRSVNQSLERLATGNRINRGADDPAGMITAENLRSVLAALEAEGRSLERTNQVANVADGVLGEISSLLAEAEGLKAANANTAGMSPDEIAANQMQIDSLVQTANRLASGASFNGQKLFDGSMTLTAHGASLSLDALSFDSATTTDARKSVTEMRGRIGAFSQNTIGAQSRNLLTTMENVLDVKSRITDTDYARETAELSRSQTLRQASILSLTAGMESAKSILKLLA